jgi:hypothetical protein
VRRFPRREAEVAALARQIVVGLTENADDFPSPPLDPTELQEALDAYKEAHLNTVDARAAFAEAVKDKDKALKTLVLGMKTDLRYAELAVSYNDTKLKQLGWRKRKEPTPMQPPGQARQLNVKREGPGWVSMDWKKPKDGGPVAFYSVQVRHNGKGEWREAARHFETAIVLKNQERGVELEYCIITVNKAGEGLAGNAVTVLL